MPHQRGDHHLGYSGRGGHAMLRDAREAPPPHSLHPAEFQRRRMAPMVVHHPSPGGRHVHGSMYPGPHPHSPAWYGSSVASSPHRVPGSSCLSVASGESLLEEHRHMVVQKREEAETTAAAAVVKKSPSEDLREKQQIIHEALRRHMDEDNSIGTNEADAASALLFATAAMRRGESSKVSVTGSKAEGEGQETEEVEEKDGDDVDNHEETSTLQGEGKEEKEKEPTESSGPLKKRRKLLDILRKKPVTTANTEKQPLHVSPLPSPQVRTRVAGHEYVEGTASAATPPRTAGSSSTCMAHSYDLKDALSLHEGAKIKDAAEISPASQVVTQHFPSVLHCVLTSSEFAGSVVQWLPDGKAWKILRWDALRRKVLPKHFSQLQDEDGKVGISIDAFLWHLAAWGFEEVQSGPDVGAYFHEFFRKDSPQLCHQMKFSLKQNELESPRAAPKKTPSTVSEKLNDATQPHSILQVPSLASAVSRSDADGSSKEAEALKWREEQRKQRSLHSPTIVYPSPIPGRHMRHPDAPVFVNVNYRLGDVPYAAEGWQYFPESPMAMRHIASRLTGYEQRLIQQQNFEFAGPRSHALHNTPRVQSGRGALRLPVISSKVGLPNLERPVVRRSSFPVSNRGKGSRGSPAAIRVSAPASETLRSSPEAKPAPDGQAKAEDAADILKFSEEVAERVAVAISKKTKRKLPLSGSTTAGKLQKQEEMMD